MRPTRSGRGLSAGGEAASRTPSLQTGLERLPASGTCRPGSRSRRHLRRRRPHSSSRPSHRHCSRPGRRRSSSSRPGHSRHPRPARWRCLRWSATASWHACSRSHCLPCCWASPAGRLLTGPGACLRAPRGSRRRVLTISRRVRCRLTRFSGNEDLSAPALITAGTALYFLAAVGISYGVLSASWDPQRKGSALGLDEVGRNAAALADRIPFFRGRR